MINTPTNFLNAKRRRIYQGERGGFFVKDSDGKMKRGIKAAFRKVGANGDESKLGPKNRDSVPVKLRRAVRKNAGKKRKQTNNSVASVVNNIVNAIVNNVAPKTRRPRRRTVMALPSPGRVVRHPMNRPKATRRRVLANLPSPARVVRHPMNRPNAANYMLLPSSPIPRLPAPPSVKRHPMTRPKASNYKNNNFGPFQSA
jgi:hypothetical protein